MPRVVITVQDLLTEESYSELFDQETIAVGRGLDANLTIALPFVSANHGTFKIGDEGIGYYDAESRKGTLLDGRSLPDGLVATIHPRGSVRFGGQHGGVRCSHVAVRSTAFSSGGLGEYVASDLSSDPAALSAALSAASRWSSFIRIAS